jgi:hypothetical protein
MISDVAEIFRDSDTERARETLTRGDELLDDFDERVSALVRGTDQGPTRSRPRCCTATSSGSSPT